MFREGRLSCPHCGADAQTGWLSDEDVEMANIDLNFTSLDEVDYEMFLKSEGLHAPSGADPERKRRPEAAPTPIPALLLLLVLFVAAVVMNL
jgi:hypothetical protein